MTTPTLCRAPGTSSHRRCGRRPTATRCGRAWPTARSTSSPPTTSPIASRSRRPRPGRERPFDKISNGAPGIETLLTIVYSEGVARGRLTVERMVDLLATTPARRFGLATKGALEVGRDADIVLFDPAARRTMRATDLHHTSDYTPYEGLEVSGAVRSVFVRGRPVIRDGAFVGRRGARGLRRTWRGRRLTAGHQRSAMPAFTSSTLSRYTGKWLIATGIFELALAALFLVLGLADAELTFGFGLTAAILGATGIVADLLRAARPPVGRGGRPDRAPQASRGRRP